MQRLTDAARMGDGDLLAALSLEELLLVGVAPDLLGGYFLARGLLQLSPFGSR